MNNTAKENNVHDNDESENTIYRIHNPEIGKSTKIRINYSQKELNEMLKELD